MSPAGHRDRTGGLSWVALFASTGTLVCCALPILLVSLGAGATVAALTSALPILVTLSHYKLWVFGVSGLLLAVAAPSCPAHRNRPIIPWIPVHTLLARKLILSVASPLFVRGLGAAWRFPTRHGSAEIQTAYPAHLGLGVHAGHGVHTPGPPWIPTAQRGHGIHAGAKTAPWRPGHSFVARSFVFVSQCLLCGHPMPITAYPIRAVLHADQSLHRHPNPLSPFQPEQI